MARQKQRTPATIYVASIRSALEHVSDPSWLGRHSPLSSPYFLGKQRLTGVRPAIPEDRGRVLQAVIRQAADKMWGGSLPATRAALAAAVDEDRLTLGNKSSRYRFYLLELRYLRRYYPLNTFPTATEAIPGFVNVSQTRFFIHLEEAIEELGRQLTELIAPALRLERPGLIRAPIGRDQIIAAVEAGLRDGRSVAVTGQGGVGKSTLGAAVSARWSGAVFWHTFRPGLNDDLGSLLFSLGHFARDEGAPMLWAQLLAGAGEVSSPDQALGMLRMDMEAIAGRRPLLVFDEVDLMQTAVGEPRRKQHAQALELLESLRGTVPLLLLGQRVYIDTEAHYVLNPLLQPESGALLNALGLEANAVTLHRVQQFTSGNPRLLELYAALHHMGDEADDLLRLPRDSSIQPLFSRLWRRLGPGEQELLGSLSVFRSYAPRDAWPKLDAAMADLVRRNLIKSDIGGGVALLPFYRELVYNAIPNGKRWRYHRDAGLIRARLGGYTAAAYHYVLGDEAALAVEVWFAHQEEEILAGQASAASEVFNAVDLAQVDESVRGKLLVIRNRLALLQGEAERVLEGMEHFTWDVDDETTADTLGQLAYAYELRDRADEALAKYDEAIDMLSRLATKLTGWHVARGLTFVRGNDIHSADREVRLARSDLEHLQGTIHLVKGHFEAAQAHFVVALRLGEEEGDKNRIAKGYYMLAIIAGRQANMPLAREHAERAMSHYRDTGNRLQLEGIRAELAGMYLNVRQYGEVIESSEQAMKFFERIEHDAWVSTISTNLAEAYMETGQLDKAREMVFKALRLEIPSARPYALYTLGHIHDREGNAVHAAAGFREGIEVARANGDRFIEAYLRRALGALLIGDQQPAAGMEQLHLALDLFGELGLEHEVAATTEVLAGRG